MTESSNIALEKRAWKMRLAARGLSQLDAGQGTRFDFRETFGVETAPAGFPTTNQAKRCHRP